MKVKTHTEKILHTLNPIITPIMLATLGLIIDIATWGKTKALDYKIRRRNKL